MCFVLISIQAVFFAKRNKRILEEETALLEVTAVKEIDAPPDLNCNYEIMRTYGMKAILSPPKTLTYCPSIIDNCCTDEDANTSLSYWNTDVKGKIERYYQIYLYSFKYLFGYTPEGYLLARRFSIEGQLTCKRAANDYLAINLNPKITLHIFNMVKNTLQKVGDIRRAFIYVDARVQSHFRDFFATTNLQNFSKLYFSKDFCLTLVEETIESAF